MTIPIIIGSIILAGVVLAIRMALKRAAEQRVAHDARLRAMAQMALAAAKKKKQQELQQANVTATAAPPAAREERECPFCAELILIKARVCKHCGRDVEPLAPSSTPAP